MKREDKYIVSLGGIGFGFNDGVNAISFATLANAHFIPGDYVKELETIVYLKGKPVEDVKEENNDDDEQ